MNTKSILCALLITLLISPLAQAAPPDWAKKGHDAYANKHYPQAIRHYQTALDRGQSTDQTDFNLIRAYMIERRMDDARKLMARVKTRHQNKASYLELQGDLARTEADWSTAEQYYSRAVKKDKRNPGLRLKYGQALQMLGDEAAADEEFAEYQRLSE